MLDYGLSLEEAFHTPRIDASARGSLRADPAMGEAALTELRKLFTLDVAQQLVFPSLYACPSGVARDPATGKNCGITAVSQPIARAAAPPPVTPGPSRLNADHPPASPQFEQ